MVITFLTPLDKVRDCKKLSFAFLAIRRSILEPINYLRQTILNQEEHALTIFVQILGLIALIAWVSSVQLRKKSDILKLQILASIFYGLHYGFLNASSAAAVSVVSIIRLLTIYLIEKTGRKVSVPLLLLFILLLIGVGVFTYTSPLSLIPILITIGYTYGTWQQNTKVLRIIFFLCGWLWIYFNYNVGSYILIVGNAMEILSSTISFFRFGIIGKTAKK